MLLAFVILIIAIALVFDFYNGMNDAANSIATIVSTRVLTPRQAVAWAAFWNFAAAFFLGTAVAKTIFKALDGASLTLMLTVATCFGAIFWTHLCTRLGLPISASHALIGGMVGAGLVQARFDLSVLNASVIGKIVLFIFLAPLIGMVIGSLLMFVVYWVFRNRTPARVDRFFRVGQLFSAAAFSLGHGANDAQKTMSIIAMTLFAAGMLQVPAGQSAPPIHMWIVLSAHTAIAMGTMIGGWRVIRTMGSKLTKLKPVQGFCAETAGAAVLFGVTAVGIPVSTTHSVAGSIMGVGSVRRLKAVRWGMARRMLWAWVLTIPCAAIAGGVAYWLLDLTGVVAWADALVPTLHG
jgi:inorganic phosphate transporter, PiT family